MLDEFLTLLLSLNTSTPIRRHKYGGTLPKKISLILKKSKTRMHTVLNSLSYLHRTYHERRKVGDVWH